MNLSQITKSERIIEASEDLYRTLKELLGVYYMNQDSDGKCPNANEFIACVTPRGIPLYWRKAKMLVNYIEQPDRAKGTT